MGKALSPFRIGTVLGAIAMAVYLLRSSSRLPFDAITWTGFAIIVACGGLFVGGAVLAWQNIRRTPAILPRAGVLLAILSLLPLVPHFREVRRAAVFMQTADSAPAVVVRRAVRGGVGLTAVFQVQADSFQVRDHVRPPEEHLKVGDTVWVYFQPGAAKEALIGRPGPYSGRTQGWLEVIWVLGGVVLLGYLAPLLEGRGWRFKAEDRKADHDHT